MMVGRRAFHIMLQATHEIQFKNVNDWGGHGGPPLRTRWDHGRGGRFCRGRKLAQIVILFRGAQFPDGGP